MSVVHRRSLQGGVQLIIDDAGGSRGTDAPRTFAVELLEPENVGEPVSIAWLDTLESATWAANIVAAVQRRTFDLAVTRLQRRTAQLLTLATVP